MSVSPFRAVARLPVSNCSDELCQIKEITQKRWIIQAPARGPPRVRFHAARPTIGAIALAGGAKFLQAFPRKIQAFPRKFQTFPSFFQGFPNFFLGGFQRNQRVGGDSGDFALLETVAPKFPAKPKRARRAPSDRGAIGRCGRRGSPRRPSI